MSKSIGNVINPFEYVENYGTDALRYYLLSKINPFEDSDFTKEGFEQVYQADLANGLGNLVSRVSKLLEINDIKIKQNNSGKLDKKVAEEIEKYRFDRALEKIWEKISELDFTINKNELWKDTKSKIKFLEIIVEEIRNIAYNLRPFLPKTANRIENQFKGSSIKSSEPLFPRIK